MKFYGHANLQQNELQNAVLSSLTTFPTSPKVGQIAFINSVVMICVSSPVNGNPPVWVPLTREITAYTHVQSSASQTWNITHDLNTSSVNIQIFEDGTNKVIIPDEIQTTGSKTATVTFGSAVAGRAVVVSGHFDGLAKPMYAPTHYQSSASTQWIIDHDLGHEPIVRVFIGNQEVQPLSITHNSTSRVTVTFSTAQVGYARLL